MNKQKYFIIFFLLLSGVGLTFYQYFKNLETEFVSATSTVPNPGHLWTQTECNTDSLCVDNTNGILSIKTNTRLGYKLATSGAGLLATNWYRIATFSASNSPTTAKIELSNTTRHQNVIINIGRGTGYYTAEVYEAGRYAYGQNIKNVRIVDMGVNQPTYIDIQVGADETGGTWTVLADVRGTNQILTLNAFVDQGAAAAGHVYPVTSIIRSFGSGISAGPSFTVTEAGKVGIGTTNPAAKLTIAGGEGSYNVPNFGSTNLGAINIVGGASDTRNAITFSSSYGSNAEAGIYVHQDNSAGTHMYFATTNNYSTGPQARLTIINSGNVGIGTTSPAQKLSVAGVIQSTIGGIMFPDGTTQTTAGGGLSSCVDAGCSNGTSVCCVTCAAGYYAVSVWGGSTATYGAYKSGNGWCMSSGGAAVSFSITCCK